MGWNSERGLRWRKLPPFGVEIDHDLSQPLSSQAAACFAELFRDHSLIIARGQALDRDRHNAVVGLLAPIIPHREGEQGFISSAGDRGEAAPELGFHADAAYTETPFEIISLHAVDVVDGASSTRFIDAQRALDRLPADLRGLLAAHDADMISPAMDQLAARICEIPGHDSPPCRCRLPAIRENARNGRQYVAVSAMHTARLHDLPWTESRDGLNAVFDRIYAPDAIHEHVWHNGDLVIWDNVGCQHARGNLDAAGRRILQRVLGGHHTHSAPHARA